MEMASQTLKQIQERLSLSQVVFLALLIGLLLCLPTAISQAEWLENTSTL